jgi:hypothetical protein
VIIYDLKCKQGHKFEGWFKDGSAFEEQIAKKLVTCPICGNADAQKVPSTVALMGRSEKSLEKKRLKEISSMKILQSIHEYIDKNFDDVGDKFAEVALKIHHGEENKKNIKGTTTTQEEEFLKEEGVQFIKIPLPKFDS